MKINQQIYIYDFVWAISEAIDLVSPTLYGHQKQVTYIAGSIAQEMKLKNEEVQDIILAAMLHDVGAYSLDEWDKILSVETEDRDLGHHAFLGYVLLKDFAPLSRAAEIIRDHHVDFCNGRKGIRTGSYIIYLANKISLLIDCKSEILRQVPGVLAEINQDREFFHPDALAAFTRLAGKESFWIEASTMSLIRADMLKRVLLSKEYVDMDTFRDFAKITAQIIDFKSRFTATHSSGVAAVAMELSRLSGFSERECKMMEIAGFLHDLGKLAVPNEILDKDGPLETDERNVIRKHTYYTHAILSRLRGFGLIAEWAAYHHEHLNGKGYPFNVKNEDFSKLSRIMAVADVITALTEDRPYRAGMDREGAESALKNMVGKSMLDGSIVALANENFHHINGVRTRAQRTARKNYEAFYESIRVVPVIRERRRCSRKLQASRISQGIRS